MKKENYFKKRFSSIEKIKGLLVILTVLFIIGLVFCIVYEKEPLYFIIGFVIVFVLICILYLLKLNNVVKEYKIKYINIALSKEFNNFKYNTQGNLDNDVLKLLCWEPYNYCDDKRKVNIKDNLSGIYKGEKFNQNSLKVTTIKRKQDLIGDGKHTENKTLFDGIITEFKLKKSYENILIYTNDISIAEFKERIKTEDEKFNKKFNISSDSKQDAFLFLTPDMMEKINYLVDEIISFSSFLLINDNKLYIGQNYASDLFEPNMKMKKIDEEKIVDDIKETMIYVKQVIDTLELGDK